MSNTTGKATKSLKIIEVPLNKFSEEVIPHHQKMLLQHKQVIQKVAII